MSIFLYIFRYSKYWILAGLILLMVACTDFTDSEIYQPPDNLEGKLYDQITNAENSDLSAFATCLELSGLSEIINRTGYYTVFAPTDDAFQIYFDNHPEYNRLVENIPLVELEKIVRFHIVQNGWTLDQLRSLDFQGWIDPENPFYNKPKGYKRATILMDSLKKEWIKVDKFESQIVKEASADAYRIVFPDSRKYVPLFYQEYFDVFDYKSEDYEFYFNRAFEGGNLIYYADGKLLTNEIPAENGFIYKIDRVVEPMDNIQQILEKKEDYSDFLSLIYSFPRFKLDLDETFNQAGAREGLTVDTLFSLSFPDLEFSINKEITGQITSTVNYTLREHNSIIAPTNAALDELYNDIILSSSGYPHYTKKSAVPDAITKIIINSHMASELLYKNDFTEGFTNGEKDHVTIDPASVIDVQYGSNGAFLGVNKAIVPFAFKSIAAPVYLRPGYQTFFNAIEYTSILPALTKSDVNYSFYIIEDDFLSTDSSLLLIWDDIDDNKFHFNAFDREKERFARIKKNDLTKWMMNQIVVEEPEGIARKEFIENLGGNYIIVNNEENSVQGALSSVYGFAGDSAVTLYPQKLEEPTENGSTYKVSGWFLNSVSSLYNVLSSHTKFLNLLDKTGLAEKITFRMLFLSETENYTVLVPTDEALEAYGVDTMSVEDLKEMLKLHFIKGHLIFTDGKKPSGLYETMQVDKERTTQFNTYFTTLDLVLGYDEIQILDKDGNVFLQIDEDGSKTNIMAARDVDEDGESRYDFVTNSIVHVIDKVIEK